MARSNLPQGLELHRGKLRIAFQWCGKRRRESVGLTPSAANINAAVKLRERILWEIRTATFNYAETFPDSAFAQRASAGSKTALFGECAEKWLAGKKSEVKLASYRKYRQVLDQVWLPRFRTTPLATIKPSDLKQALTVIDWQQRSPKRWNDVLIPLRGIFQAALEDELLQSDPSAKLRNKVPTPDPADPLTIDEVERFLVHLQDRYGSKVRGIFEVLFFTGMRPGELIALCWSDIDFGTHTIAIHRSRNLGVDSSTKTHRGRHHEMLGRVEAVFKEWKAHTYLAGAHVFHHPRLGVRFHEIRSLREVWWDPALRALGMRGRNFYNTRHTYASWSIMQGANPYYIAQQMGTSPELVFETYGKWIKAAGNAIEQQKLERALKDR